jgi:hypothetical protein
MVFRYWVGTFVYIAVSFVEGVNVAFNYFRLFNIRGHFAYQGTPRALSFSITKGYNNDVINYDSSTKEVANG